MRRLLLYRFLLLALTMAGCSQEYSYEGGPLPLPTGGPAEFTIVHDGTPSICSGATAQGNYIIDMALTAANKVTLTADVTKTGPYTITAGPIQGIIFSATGTFASTGTQPVILTATGTPSGSPGVVSFPVTAGSSNCSFNVNITKDALFKPDCSTAVPGSNPFQQGSPLTANHTVDISVNVLLPGTYSITTAVVNGIYFTTSGVFTSTGVKTITLTGHGTPLAEGIFQITVPGTEPCSFDLEFTGADMVWRFWADGVLNEGATNIYKLHNYSTRQSLTVSGPSNPWGRPIGIDLDREGSVTAGTYTSFNTTPSALFYFRLYNPTNTAQPILLYGYPNKPGIDMVCNLTTFDLTTRIAEGTFSGTCRKNTEFGVLVNITNGYFKMKFRL